MTPTTKTAATPEELRDTAARLRGEAAVAEAELRQRDDAERAALAARQESFDRELVASWNPGAHADEVERTAAALDEAVRSDPLVKALLAAFHARSRRRALAAEVVSAMSRLGRDVSGAQLPDAPPPPSVGDLVARTVERLSAEMMTAERSEMDARRNGESE